MKPIPFQSQTEAALRKYKMLAPGERLLIACSGGADSAALVHCLHQMAAQWKLRLNLIHFDHGLRRGSNKDFRFVELLARRLNLPFYGGRRAKKVSLKPGL